MLCMTMYACLTHYIVTLLCFFFLVQSITEKFLEVCNPYPVVVKWHLESVGSSFVRGVSPSLCKANYSAFWVQQCSGSMSALGRTAVS